MNKQFVYKMGLTLGLLFLTPQVAHAVLSPLNQSIVEIKTIIQSAELENYLPQSSPIIEIKRAPNGYLLNTEQWQVLAEIQYLPSSYPGRQQFKILFHPATPLDKK